MDARGAASELDVLHAEERRADLGAAGEFDVEGHDVGLVLPRVCGVEVCLGDAHEAGGDITAVGNYQERAFVVSRLRMAKGLEGG